jgi:glycosyltransferase involved in cell wall biosynthesis
MISALILTSNEAINIADCISSLAWRADVHVLDSDSSDETRQIASMAGAKVHVRRFTNYADQRNFGLALPFANEWIVVLDADERMTPELAFEVEERIRGARPDDAMYLVRRKDIFMGRWLRRASGYPTWFARVFRRGRVLVARDVNEEYRADGRVTRLDGHILHIPFNNGIEWWFERHNRYSTLEAKLLLDERASRPIHLREIFNIDPTRQRAVLKQFAYRLPTRPMLVFFYLYVVRLGFLDGRAGLQFALMRFAYEIMIDAKITAARYEGVRAQFSNHQVGRGAEDAPFDFPQ